MNPHRPRLHNQDGFTMALVLGVLLLATSLGIAAFSAARGEIHVSAVSKDRKQAYAAAEAGLNWYQSRLAGDNAYWSKCIAVPDVAPGQPAPVNQQWSTGADPRRWRAIPGSTAEYTIELLPAPGKTSCNSSASNGGADMVDPATGSFRIRATGRFHGEKRSVVARFRRARFLDFLWFTYYETTDPLAYPSAYRDYANANCKDRYRTARDAAPYGCLEIQFANFDKLNGPLHTNDSLLICGSATFGRPGSSDKVESFQSEDTSQTGSPSPGWRPSCNPTTPNFAVPFKFGQQPLEMPATNATLASNVLPAYKFTGETILELKSDNTIDVTPNGQAKRNVPWPANGLIYVADGGCGSTQPPVAMRYSEGGGCANVVVKGTYSRDLTIASAKDIVINGNVTRNGDVLLGLIADQFVRVYHPATVSATDETCGPNKNDRYGNWFDRVTIEAAILSLQHSFTADNYGCGAGLDKLTVTGAIAQRYRGAVAQGGSGSAPDHGFIKDYNYDDRLKYRNPPYFLEPVDAAWRLLRSNEQVPTR